MRRAWLVILTLTVACADEMPEDVSARMEAAREANRPATDTIAGTDSAAMEALIMSTPSGGHAAWVDDIRTGLDTVVAAASVDRGEALYTVQELYTRRFDPLRQFYGAGGVASPSPQLAQAVESAGAQLQELMRNLAGDAADGTVIEGNVRMAKESLDHVEAAARAANLAPSAPRDVLTTGS